MEKVQLGNTGLNVSRLGIGLSEIGSSDESVAKNVLINAFDSGINFFDTSSCYNRSEEFFGKVMSSNRDEIVLDSKCGHASRFDNNLEDWSYKGVKLSIERSLKLLKTDRLDLIQIHSCTLKELNEGETFRAMSEAKEKGKVLHLGFSGDNEAAIWAAKSGLFDTIQTSFNLVEQKARYELLEIIKKNNIGLIAKRPIANGAWRALENPHVHSAPSNYAEEYYRRAQIIGSQGRLKDEPEDRILTSMGFVFGFSEVNVGIIGTQNPNHLKSNVKTFNDSLPISKNTISELCDRYDNLGKDWEQRT